MVHLVCLDCWERTLYITFLAIICISPTNVCSLNVSRCLFLTGSLLTPPQFGPEYQEDRIDQRRRKKQQQFDALI